MRTVFFSAMDYVFITTVNFILEILTLHMLDCVKDVRVKRYFKEKSSCFPFYFTDLTHH